MDAIGFEGGFLGLSERRVTMANTGADTRMLQRAQEGDAHKLRGVRIKADDSGCGSCADVQVEDGLGTWGRVNE